MYIWEKEIQEVKGNLVVFTDGTEQEYTDTQLSYVQTEQKLDATGYMDLVSKKLVDEFMKVIKNAEDIGDTDKLSKSMIDVMEQHNASELELRYATKLAQMKCIEIFKIVQDTFDYNLNIAIGKAFGTYEEGWYHAIFQENIRMSNIKKFLN